MRTHFTAIAFRASTSALEVLANACMLRVQRLPYSHIQCRFEDPHRPYNSARRSRILAASYRQVERRAPIVRRLWNSRQHDRLGVHVSVRKIACVHAPAQPYFGMSFSKTSRTQFGVCCYSQHVRHLLEAACRALSRIKKRTGIPGAFPLRKSTQFRWEAHQAIQTLNDQSRFFWKSLIQTMLPISTVTKSASKVSLNATCSSNSMY